MGRIFSRHIFTHVALTTVILTFVLVFGAWLTQSLRFIEVIIEKDVSVNRYLSMVWLLLPDLTSVVLPICTLLATVYIIYKLTADNEMVVYKAIGLSNLQIATPFIVWGLLMTIACGILNNYLGPKSNEQFYGIRNEIAREFSAGLLRAGSFNKLRDTVIYVGSHTESGLLEGIYIHERERHGVPGFTIFAQHGFLQEEGGHNILYLFNGNRQSASSSTSSPTIAYFNEFKYDINVHREVVAKVKLHTTYGFSQLINPPAEISETARIKMLIEAHKRIINPLFVITFVLLAAMILLTGQQHRRGRWKQILSAVGGALLLELVVITLLNSLSKNQYAVLMSYSMLGFCIALGLGVLIKPEWLSNLLRRLNHVS
ncbi:LptF/LptG family permease [Candidatus Odyssella thessalonicensis]|uniref:LptF/LptG family permease n=1 Tax=Candidatus Odyssella thessalonicensis TaxID=84647 RepID=UPI000225BB21|nr:LptF/LptG family permease [Candidatus Odyssella thessalonicensis]